MICRVVGRERTSHERGVAPEDRPVPTIDVHAHAIVPAAMRHLADPAAAEHRRREAETFGPESVRVNDAAIQAILPRLTDLDVRLQAMDSMAVDVQLVSPSPAHYHDWAPPALGAEISREVNEGVAALCRRAPQRLAGLGIVPLQHPRLAADELEFAVGSLGLRGVEISTSAGGLELSHPSLECFWERAEALDALVFIHPWGCSLGSRLGEHYLANTVGNPTETTLAVSHLVFSGLLDRRPGLRLLLAHGGGYLPFYIGRSDHAWTVRPEARSAQRPPSEYLRELYFDSLVYSPHALRALVAQVGAERVMLGSDFPFDMGVADPLERLVAARLAPADLEAIRGGTAVGLLGGGVEWWASGAVLTTDPTTG
jgi:aminocarboxymuconate-semialdehyde decarboxylase